MVKGWGDIRKAFGMQRERLWSPTLCDIVMSTWDVHGVGSYTTSTYAKSSPVDLVALAELMKPYLRTLHVQNYTLYEPIFHRMAMHRRTFHGWHSKEGLITKPYLRSHSYSQAYKMDVAVKLTDGLGVRYDVYVRMRPDLRVEMPISFGFHHKSSMLYLRVDQQSIYLNSSMLSVADREPSDFAFVGVPSVMRCVMSEVWTHECNQKGVLDPQHNPSVVGPDTMVMNYLMWYQFRQCAPTVHTKAWVRISRRAGMTLNDIRAKNGDNKLPL
jgi:hypothetical protein